MKQPVEKYRKKRKELHIATGVNGEEMQEVDKFNYLGVMISTDHVMGEEVAHRVLEGR